MKWISVVLVLCVNNFMSGQVSFSNESERVLAGQDFRSGNPMGIADINGDGLDDILVLDQGRTPYLGLNGGAQGSLRWTKGTPIGSGNEYAMNIGNIDNDGWSEILISGIYNRIKLLDVHDNVVALSKTFGPLFFAQGTNLIDVNSDGLLDFFGCNDDGVNILMLQGLDATWQQDNERFNWITEPESDNSGSYASEFADIDNDGDLDLGVAKCRLGVESENDPRRINMLQINSDGQFTNDASSRGFDDGSQSWTVNFTDLDNDGDFDAYVSNHHVPHKLLINDGNGIFTEEEDMSEMVSHFTFQSFARDFDNNGFEDILLLGQGAPIMLWNQGNLLFEREDGILDNTVHNSATVGDLNHDGFLDIMVSFGQATSPGSKSDEVLLSDGNQNDFLQVILAGRSSNKDGVGATLRLHTSLGVMTRNVRAGESYGVTASRTQHFGLAKNQSVELLEVVWPSGIIDSIFNLPVNTRLLVEEQGCATQPVALETSSGFLCDSLPVVISAPLEYSNYQWSDGSETDSLVVTQAGVYNCTLTDLAGCSHLSEVVMVEEFDQELDLVQELKFVQCEDELLEFSIDNRFLSYQWDGTVGDNTFATDEEGQHTLLVVNACGESIEDSFSLEWVDTTFDTLQNDTILLGEDVELVAKGQQTIWYSDESSIMPVFKGDTLKLSNVNQERSYFVVNEVSQWIDMDTIVTSSSEDIGPETLLGQMFFKVRQPLLLNSFEVYTEVAGIRKFKLYILNEFNSDFCELEVNLQAGWNRVPFECELDASETIYILSTDEQMNMSVLGTVSPQLSWLSQGISYPMGDRNLIEFLNSGNGKDYYFHYFNIDILSNLVECQSDRQEIKVVLKMPDSTTGLATSNYRVHPIPTKNILYIENDEGLPPMRIEVFNMDGKKMIEFIETTILDVSNLSGGVYIARCYDRYENPLGSFQIIKI